MTFIIIPPIYAKILQIVSVCPSGITTKLLYEILPVLCHATWTACLFLLDL